MTANRSAEGRVAAALPAATFDAQDSVRTDAVKAVSARLRLRTVGARTRTSAMLATAVVTALAGALSVVGAAAVPTPAAAFVHTSALSTVFATTESPVDRDAHLGASAELGMRFRPLKTGLAYGVRYFRGIGDFSNHRASLWASDGTLLAQIVLDGPAQVGWQYGRFGTPVNLIGGDSYVVSYHSQTVHVQQAGGFNTDRTNGPLQAPRNTTSSANGLLTYASTSVFPRVSSASVNYYADILFQPASAIAAGTTSSGATPSVTADATATSTVSPSPTPTTTTPAPPGRAAPLFAPPTGETYLGVSTDFTRLDAFDAAAGITGPAIYNRWSTPDGAFQPTLDQAASRPGLTPMVSWNLPLDGAQVTNGSRDSYITAQAQAVRSYGRPVFIRLDWEMNAYWYPHWNVGAVTPAQYVASWRHVYALFHAAGVTNAAFVWAPNALDYFTSTGQRVTTDNWYPGDDVVNWIGLDAYPQSAPSDVLLNGHDAMNAIAGFAAAHTKPVMLAEWAPNTPHPDTADPINLVFDWAESHPNVKALVYFDFVTQGKDFTLTDHPVGAATYRARTHLNPRYLLGGTVR